MEDKDKQNSPGFEEILAEKLAKTPEDALLLAAWLHERYADAVMDDDGDADAGTYSATQDNHRLAGARGGYDKKIAAGQIRILSKRYVTTPDDIPYVAVLEEWEDGLWLVAPFSKYSFPATDGEMVTGMRHAGLRVIQAWNCRTVHAELLGDGFEFGMLSDAVRKDALALFRNRMAGTELPQGFGRLCGSPIFEDADPRIGYLDSEIERLGPLSVAVRNTENALAAIEAQRQFKVIDTRGLFGRHDSPQTALAAGNRQVPVAESYDLSAEYGDGILKCELELTYSPGYSEVSFDLSDLPAEFYDEDCYEDLRDWWRVLSPDRKVLGRFQDGCIILPADAVKDGFSIVDGHGRPVSVEKKYGRYKTDD